MAEINWNRVVLAFYGTPLSEISIEVARPLTAAECSGLTTLLLKWLTENAGPDIGAIVVGPSDVEARETVAREAVIAAAREIERGCACAYDYRCCKCDRVVELGDALEALDKARAR